MINLLPFCTAKGFNKKREVHDEKIKFVQLVYSVDAIGFYYARFRENY